MPRPLGQLDRALDALTTGLLGGKIKRDRQLSYSAMREVEQQVRVPLSGEAGSGWGSIDKTVGFLFPFIYAPDQRGVPWKTPHFSYGVEMGVGTNVPIVVHAHVLHWIENNSSWITGARVRFMAQAAIEEVVKFSALAHLTFQGWAAEYEEGT